MDDRRVLSVQIGESVGRVGQVCEHARWSKSGLPASAQQPREVDAVDPVHGDDVVVGIEEVLAHEGKRGMRRKLEQNPCLSQQVLPIRRVAYGAELERDEPIVLVVEGLEDPPLAACSQRFQELVALPQKLSHRIPGAPCASRTLCRMVAAIEVVSAQRSARVELRSGRMTVGTASENDIALDDPAVSHLHAVFERFPAGWCVTDVGSSNGTWLNGERIWSLQRVRHDDEIRIGQTRLFFRESTGAAEPETESEDAPPSLTARERDVLVALCRPLLARDMFTEPASTRTIADELVISQAAVKQHLANLFDKFAVGTDDANRRLRLANDAIRRGAVTIADLRGHIPEA